MSESFPCLVCGKVLRRVSDDNEPQPYDALMCDSDGNYGSTIFDPIGSGERLHFNICDACMKAAAEQGRVMVRRHWRGIDTDYMNFVGREMIDRPYIPWRVGLAEDRDRVYVSVNDLEAVSQRDNVELRFDLKVIRDYVAEMDGREAVIFFMMSAVGR